MEENKTETLYCSHCGAVISDDEDYETIDGDIVCTDCVEQHTTTCDRCGAIIWTSESYGDDYTTLCSHCYHNHYTRCSCCDALLHEDDAYHLDGYDYCSECYHDRANMSSPALYGYPFAPPSQGYVAPQFDVTVNTAAYNKNAVSAYSQFVIMYKLQIILFFMS